MATLALEADLPQTIGEAFAHIGKVTTPTIADFKVMVLVEAASETLYRRTAEGTDNAAVIALLHANGAEEMKHARRVSEVIRVLGGGEFPAPPAQDNPYLASGSFPFAEVTPAALRKLSAGEFGGEALYETWAASIANTRAADLLRANGREETDHGNRLLQAAALLEA
jgi:rubrerythrin